MCSSDLDQPGVNPEASLWYFAERVNLSQGGRKVIWKLVTPDATLELGREGTLERVEDESPRNRIAWTVASRILGPQRAKDLRESIEAGGHLLWVWDRVEPGEELVDYSDLKGILDTWFGEKEVQVTESPGRQYHLLQDVNMNHPVFVSLSDPKFSDFSKVRFWRHRNFVGWDSNAWDVLANYSDGNPALLQRRLGKGLVTIMTSGWQPADSQLALSSKFVPILSGIFEQAVPEPRVEFSYCGDPVPEGRGLPVEAKNRTYESPGFYATGRSGTSIGVNVAKSEQITEPMELSEFDQIGRAHV